jgi:hypothetical protein
MGKLSSYIFLYMKNEDPFQFSLYTDLEKVDLDKLYGLRLISRCRAREVVNLKA